MISIAEEELRKNMDGLNVNKISAELISDLAQSAASCILFLNVWV